ncbi:MAG: hypothetical protein KatS3mg125_0183 [Lysobacterales bacterium]|nr:MAG: hypothetical protein KatS3mg125_0183 [Xanthomonadales bacterium]
MAASGGSGDRAFRALALVGALGVVLVLAADVGARELFGRGFDGAGELALLAMILWVAAGTALAAREGRELRLRVLDGLAPAGWDLGFQRLADALAALGYFALSLGMLVLALESLRLGEGSAVLGIPPALGMLMLALAFFGCGGYRLRAALAPPSRPAQTTAAPTDEAKR